ncbi:hypothetical protein [Streptomyces sp. NPDC056713]|uniref:hypothetical protein n=1 Tax=Streptomyces sp. NPDC056713 TaxID=3345921 RepID=UPI0036B5B40B
MRNFVTIAKPQDLSTGFSDFFKTIGLTGGGLVTKAIAAVIVVIAIRMLLGAANNPQTALRKGMLGVGTLFVAIVLALYGDALFSTVTQAKG